MSVKIPRVQVDPDGDLWVLADDGQWYCCWQCGVDPDFEAGVKPYSSVPFEPLAEAHWGDPR